MNSLNEFDPKKFWQDHDKQIKNHGPSGSVLLSHDLYRGMPEWFNQYFSTFQQRAFKTLLRERQFPQSAKAIDLGCGTGRWIGLMGSLGWDPVGIDLGFQAIEFAKVRWNAAKFVVGAIPDLCFQMEWFDIAVSVTVIQHLPRNLQQEALHAVGNLLKPGGYFFICESIYLDEPSPHVFSNSYPEWVKLFQNAGFYVEKAVGTEFLPIVNTFQKIRGRLKKPSSSPPDVSAVANVLHRNLLFRLLVKIGISIAYPLEWISSFLLPIQRARLVFFCLRKI